MECVKFKPLKEKFISVAWYIGSVCNYSCSYCNPELSDGKIKFSDYNPFIRFTDKLKKKYPGQKVVLTLYGGEVTLWKQFKEFLEVCKSKEIYVRIVTNGSRSIRWWKTVAHLLSHPIVSYHTEYANEKHITELMKLFRHGCCQVNLMVLPDNFDEVIQLGRRISENAKVFVIPKFLRLNFTNDLYPYTDEQLEFFEKTASGFGNEYLDEKTFKHYGILIEYEDGKVSRYKNARQIFLKNLNHWRNWKCWGGIDSFFVDYRGDVFVGQCRQGKFANINSKKYKLPDDPFTCKIEVCNCTQDILEMKKERY